MVVLSAPRPVFTLNDDTSKSAIKIQILCYNIALSYNLSQ